jgi:hypothetical protein
MSISLNGLCLIDQMVQNQEQRPLTRIRLATAQCITSLLQLPEPCCVIWSHHGSLISLAQPLTRDSPDTDSTAAIVRSLSPPSK